MCRASKYSKCSPDTVDMVLKIVTSGETTYDKTNCNTGSLIQTGVQFLQHVSGHKIIIRLLNKEPQHFNMKN